MTGNGTLGKSEGQKNNSVIQACAFIGKIQLDDIIMVVVLHHQPTFGIASLTGP